MLQQNHDEPMYTEFKNKLEHLDALIRRKATGNPKELADKLGISERAWYRLRDFLTNDLQVPLSYCTKRKTYYYHREGNLMLGWRPLREDQTGKISGGNALVYSNSILLEGLKGPYSLPQIYFNYFLH